MHHKATMHPLPNLLSIYIYIYIHRPDCFTPTYYAICYCRFPNMRNFIRHSKCCSSDASILPQYSLLKRQQYGGKLIHCELKWQVHHNVAREEKKITEESDRLEKREK